MKITLTNFRCYEKSSFDFGDNGLTLIAGSSGAGKTSIILGIYFALFGTGNKLPMYGKKSCSVSLEVDNMIITRKKSPNHLVVKTNESEYEDEAAQSIINKKYGESFKTTGYISQNARDSFIVMSPIEKLTFLESFAFNDINLSEIKKRCKDLIKERNETLLKTTSQLEMATLMFNEIVKPEKVDFPLKCMKKNREKMIKNEIIKDKNIDILLKRCRKKIFLLQKELHSLNVLNAKVQSKQESLDSVTEKLSELSLVESKLSYEGDDKLCEYEEQLVLCISQRELILLQSMYDEDIIRLQNMKDEETSDKNEKIETIQENLWKESTEQECKITITEYKQIIKDLEKISDLNNDLLKYTDCGEKLDVLVEELEISKLNYEEKKKLLDKLEMQQEIFQCPSCSVPLRFHDDELHIQEETYDGNELVNIDIISDEIKKIQKVIKSLESLIPIKKNKIERYKEISKSISSINEQYEVIPNMNEIKEDLDYIMSYKSTQILLYRQLNELQANYNYSSTITSFVKSLIKQEKKIEVNKYNMNKHKFKDLNEEELRLNIINQKQTKEKLGDLGNDIRLLSKEQTTYKKQLSNYNEEHLEKYIQIKNESEIKSEYKKAILELSNLEEKGSTHKKNVENIEKYNEYKKAIESYTIWTTKIDVLQKEEVVCRKLYASATLLREKILEAESIAMLNIISSINTHSQVYLDAFFPDNPISVKLEPFKESKSGSTKGSKKPQINLEIEYKGMEADINMLSGGELSRVILAYALALGEMFNTPLMLLDECTASLDQDLTGSVMDGIRDNFSGSLVLIIAHQTVRGIFDKVIEI
jgi:DNA repair exonuclease SbcCD ATPase subunit